MGPVQQWSRYRHRARDRSHWRPATYGPRSMTGTVTWRPCQRKVTSVRSVGARRLIVFVRAWAVPLRKPAVQLSSGRGAGSSWTGCPASPPLVTTGRTSGSSSASAVSGEPCGQGVASRRGIAVAGEPAARSDGVSDARSTTGRSSGTRPRIRVGPSGRGHEEPRSRRGPVRTISRQGQRPNRARAAVVSPSRARPSPASPPAPHAGGPASHPGVH
jgi:hypothetical protein